MKLALNNKVVMVAASSSGLGYAIALEAAREGARVAMASRSEAEIKKAAETIAKSTGAEVTGTAADFSLPDAATKWQQEVFKQWGRVDALLVNTGGPSPGMFDELTDDQWQQGFDLVLMSAVRLIRSVLPTMRKQGSGSIATITSLSYKEPIDNLLLSNTLRSAVANLVKSLSAKLAEDGIRINNLVPGMISTDRVGSLVLNKASRAGITYEEAETAIIGQIPLKRMGSPAEFARAALFLLSDASSYITGASLVVDGGKVKSVQ